MRLLQRKRRRRLPGQRPHGVFDTELAGEGLGLLADRGEIWQQRWLSGSLPSWDFNFNGASQPAALYQPRYLSDSGRLFFNSADALVRAGHERQGGRL